MPDATLDGDRVGGATGPAADRVPSPSGATAREVERLLAAEPDVPGLRLLLDAEALAGWAAATGAHPLADGRYAVRYLRWKPGAGGVARLVPAERALPEVFLAVWHTGAAAKLAKGVGRAGRHAVHVDPDRLALVARAAGDRDLPGLRLVAPAAGDEVPARPGRDVRRALRGRTSLRPLAWKPGRRWVGRASSPDGALDPVVVRAYRPADLGRAVEGWRTVAGPPGPPGAAGRVRAPRPLAVDARRGLLVTEHLPGVPLDRLLAVGDARVEGALAAAGAVLADLHRLGPPRPPAQPADPLAAEIAAVRAAGRMLRRLRPDVLDATAGRTSGATLVDDVVRGLLRGGSGPLGPVHGDLSADQILVDARGRVSVLDLDEAGRGPLVADVADLAASWLVEAPAAADDRLGRLLDGYAARGGSWPDPDALRPWLAARLLRRAVAPFRTGSPTWAEQTDELLRRVRGVLDRGQR
ncbi:phosphotransferase [Aquipuribacter nitratireducens]|uniref:Phosphotransferase n=1 Tax=Aquipuribacter nitratireducens TaxID=650104 RepID=A0ABW0GLW1_9MICO